MDVRIGIKLKNKKRFTYYDVRFLIPREIEDFLNTVNLINNSSYSTLCIETTKKTYYYDKSELIGAIIKYEFIELFHCEALPPEYR